MKHTKCYIAGHPRPQFVRKDWKSLNGTWKFAFGEEVNDAAAKKGDLARTICVPFTYETKKSGIGDTSFHESVWYSREIEGKAGKRTLLYIGGADYETEVYVNGSFVGRHVGAYTRFCVDVTPYLRGNRGTLCIKCTDSNSPVQVRGKQRWERENFGCWYVQTTGIWKSVWLEYVDKQHLTELKMTPSLQDNSVTFSVGVSHPCADAQVRIAISFDGKPVQDVCVNARDAENEVCVRLDSGALTYQVEQWSVWSPALYDVEIEVWQGGKKVDAVGSYFGLREFVAKDGKLLFNNLPYYLRLLLDQGYWPESGITPPSEEAIERDIRLSKEMGFNGVRKHQKVEDDVFLYYADILGFVVWCELPSNHWYSDEASERIVNEWMQIVRQNYNHPSVVTWVIFNESWGVRNIFTNGRQSALATALYYLTKNFDPMRPVISNDGWMHAKSDILTLHHYEQDGEKLYSFYDDIRKLTEGDAGNSQFLPYAEGYRYEGQPIVMSEFGGTAYVNDEKNGWGYGAGVKSDEEYIARLRSLVSAISKMHISGYCYTQITDVEQEVNGILRADRTPKVPVEEIAKINRI